MARGNLGPVVGGMSIVGIAAALAAGAAKMAREVGEQEAITESLELLDGVEHAVVDVRKSVLPWARTQVTGSVALHAPGVEEIEELFDECVRVVRDILDAHGDYTADIDLTAEPVDPPEEAGARGGDQLTLAPETPEV